MNHGIIEKLEIPARFHEVSTASRVHNYVEFKATDSSARICYEETPNMLSHDQREKLEAIFDSTNPGTARKLQISPNGEEASASNISVNDYEIYTAICRCFVFGGQLVRDGAFIDENLSSWEICTIGTEPSPRRVILGRLQFRDANAKLQTGRRALLVVPIAPSEGGNGYIWLEGTQSELDVSGDEFLSKIAAGLYRQLAAPPI